MVKGTVNALDHKELCLVLHRTNTSVDAKRAGLLILLPTFILGSKYLLPAKEGNF